MLAFHCLACGQKLRAPLHFAGKGLPCPRCGATITVPDANGQSSATLPPIDPMMTQPPPADSQPTMAPSESTLSATGGTVAVAGYEVLGELGRGGMGVVYKARQRSLNRVVALKMILVGGHAGEETLARFRTEAEAVARLQHPNIVQVFEVGDAGGLPFLSLEFVEGGSLERKLAATPLPPGEAAALVEALAEAMHYAHERGVVHRDLKPANVLLSPSARARSVSDGSAEVPVANAPGSGGVPKITDFGLAKKVGEQSQTQTGAIMGTPSYMAPEQAEAKKEVGPPADVYALGAILYECLTGRPPFRAATSLDTILQVISDEPVPPRQLNANTPRDLETIALKCLQKEPSRRYASAAALAADLRAFQEDRPIAARPVGRMAQAWRWCKRNRAVASLLTLVMFVLATAAVLSTGLGVEARRQARAATFNFEQANFARDALAKSKRDAEESLYYSRMNIAFREWQDAGAARTRALLDGCDPTVRGWEWHFLDRIWQGSLFELRGHQATVKDFAVAPLGGRAVTAGFDGQTILWDAVSGANLLNLKPAAYRLAFSHDGRRIAGVAANPPVLQIWDASTGQPLRRFPFHDKVCGLAFVGSNELAVATVAGEVSFYSTDTEAELRRCPKRLQLDKMTNTVGEAAYLAAFAQGQFHVVFSPDGKLAAQGGLYSGARVWDTATGELILEGKDQLTPTGGVAFSPDGKRLAAPSGTVGTIYIWDLQTRKSTQQLHGHRGQVHAVAFSPDGKRLASGSRDTTARVWDLESGQTTRILTGHESEVYSVRFSADGQQYLYTTSPDARIKAWDIRPRDFYSEGFMKLVRERGLPTHAPVSCPYAWSYYSHLGPVLGVAFSPDSRLAATAAYVAPGSPSEVCLWDLESKRVVRSLPVPHEREHHLDISPDGKLLAVGTSGFMAEAPGELRLFEVASGKLLHTWPGVACARAKPEFSPDGKFLACIFTVRSQQSSLIVREVATGKEILNQSRENGLLGPCFLDETRIATMAADGWARVRDVRTGEEIRSWQVGPPSTGQMLYTALATSKEGVVAIAGNPGRNPVIRLFDGTSGEVKATLEGHVGVILSLAFSPDGSRVVSAASDFTVKVWHAGSGKEMLSFKEHRDVPFEVAWSPDGQSIASGGRDGVLKVIESEALRVPSTDKWEPLYRDSFDRADLGKHWLPQQDTRWSLRDGALRGDLTLKQGGAAQFLFAEVQLAGVELPRTVEVRFSVETSEPMLICPEFYNPRLERILMPLLAGVNQPFGIQGVTVFMAASAGGMKFTQLAVARELTLEPKVRHRIRIVRTPRKLWMYVNDREAISAPVPDLETPVLQLQGSWAKGQGASIGFADLEIRAPASAVRERLLHRLVEQAFDRLGTRQDAAKVLDKDARLTPEDRAEVRKILDELREDPDQLLRASLAMTAKVKATVEERALAVRQAEAAWNVARSGETSIDRLPRASLFLTAVGLAKLRNGQAKEAFADLLRAVEIRRTQHGAAVVRQLAGLALAARGMGQPAEAARYRQQMRDLLRNAPDDERNEAESWVKEVEAAIKPATDAAEQEAIFAEVADCEDAGWLRRDLKRYMDGRANEVREVAGRSAKPDAHDVVFDRTKLAATRAWDFRDPNLGQARLRFENVAATRDGDRATLRYESTIQIGDWWRTWEVHWQLTRAEGRWKSAQCRSWQVRGLEGGRGERYDEAWWKARDDEAGRAEGVAKADALMAALRAKDALALMRRRTAEKGATAEEWAARGKSALKIGEVDEARIAFESAERLNPLVGLSPAVNGPILDLLGPKNETFSVAFSPSGELFSGGRDGVLRVWDAAGKLVRSVKHQSTSMEGGHEILALAVSPDGKRLALARSGISIRDASTLEETHRAQGHLKQIYRIAFSSDGSQLVSASADGTARVWDAASGQMLHELKGHTGHVLGAEFSPDGRHIATASRDRTARLWDVKTGQFLREFKGHRGQLLRVAFASGGKILATCGDGGEVKVWDVETANEVKALSVGPAMVETVAFSPDGKLLAAAGDNGEMRLWSTIDWRLVRVPRGGENRIFSLAFSPDGKRLAAGSADDAVRVWEVPAAK